MRKKITSYLLITTIVSMVLVSLTSTRSVESFTIEEPFTIQEVTSDQIMEDLSVVSPEEPLPISEDSPVAEEEDFTYRPNKHKDLLVQNQDYIGWIQIPGTQISNPIVKARDNDYYLKRNFFKEYDEKGAIYMDHRNIGFQFSNHILLYGHNMRDGSMFGELDLYKSPEFALNNDLIVIEDLYVRRYFQVYASYFDDANAAYIQTNLSSQDIGAFSQDQILRSDIDYGITPGNDDKILTLVTCSYEVDNGRFFVHGKEIAYEPHPKRSDF